MAKKRKIQQQKQKPRPGPQHTKPPRPDSKPAKPAKPEAKAGTQNPRPAEQKPTIPFSPEDAILLVGEGDLSFSRALVEHHCCENVTATVLEANIDELTVKYPHIQENVDLIEGKGSKVVYGVDAKKMGPWAKKVGKDSTGIFDRISTRCPSLSLYRIHHTHITCEQ